MHHDPLRGTLGVEDVQDVGVRLTIVDDQRQLVRLRPRDVGRKGALLAGVAGGVRGAEIVEAGLPHASDARR